MGRMAASIMGIRSGLRPCRVLYVSGCLFLTRLEEGISPVPLLPAAYPRAFSV